MKLSRVTEGIPENSIYATSVFRAKARRRVFYAFHLASGSYEVREWTGRAWVALGEASTRHGARTLMIAELGQ